MSAYGRPFSCRTALFLFSPPLSPVESVDLGVLSSPLARLLRLLPLVPSSSLSELRRGRDPARRLRRKKEVRQRLDERTEESDGATRLDGDGSRDPEHLREEIRPGPSCSSEKINLMFFLCLLLRHDASFIFIFPNWFCVKSSILDFNFYSLTPISKASAPSGRGAANYKQE